MILQKLEVFVIPDEAPTIIWFWIISIVLALVLIDTQKLKGKVSILIYFIIVFYAGILLGGIPNVSIPIERTLHAISYGNPDLSDLLHAYAIFGIIIGTSFFLVEFFVVTHVPLG
jgi:hypothetical protein